MLFFSYKCSFFVNILLFYRNKLYLFVYFFGLIFFSFPRHFYCIALRNRFVSDDYRVHSFLPPLCMRALYVWNKMSPNSYFHESNLMTGIAHTHKQYIYNQIHKQKTCNYLFFPLLRICAYTLYIHKRPEAIEQRRRDTLFLYIFLFSVDYVSNIKNR